MEPVHIKVTDHYNNERVDKIITALQEDHLSRSLVQQLIKEKRIQVNGEIVLAKNHKCITGDIIHVDIPEPQLLDVKAEPMALDIIYEDEDVLVVNKPRGMVVHPAPGHPTGTLVNGLVAHCDDLSGINGVMRPGIVHRIDKDTSGLLVVAKNDRAHQHLVEQMKEKTTTRKYKAIVHGVVPHNKGTVDAPIGRNKQDRQSMCVTDVNSKEAVTHFNVLDRFEKYTYIECTLETGRTHQIRVHLNYIGYPLAGDPKYGPKKTIKMNGQALHAETLGFVHPRLNDYLEFHAPVPDDMEHVLKELRSNLS